MISAIKKLLVAASIVAGSAFAITAHVTQAAPLQDLGPAPALAGIDHWINSPPLNIEQLRGKVVLVDFWTYTCIN